VRPYPSKYIIHGCSTGSGPFAKKDLRLYSYSSDEVRSKGDRSTAHLLKRPVIYLPWHFAN
jgi:hypothetical protein